MSYSKEYGQPGPHAYKVDTLIVNRRLDEAPRPLPEVLRLGSLREINRELGLAEDDTQTVKRALIQNASAFISAKIRYKPKNARDGRERWREIHYTRYSILFNGDVLPDGRIADAVYIVLNPPHRKMLNDAEVRPLDRGGFHDEHTGLQPFQTQQSHAHKTRSADQPESASGASPTAAGRRSSDGARESQTEERRDSEMRRLRRR